MNYKDRFDKERRDLLKIIAGAGITPALLRASALVGGLVHSRAAEAQAAGKATKSLLMLQTGGALDNLWRPTGSPGALKMGPMSMAYAPVSGLVAFVAGATLTAGQHGHMFHRFTDGSFNEDSFDVNMGRTIGATRPVQFLNLGVETKTDVLSRQGKSGIPTIDDPKTAFKRLFGGGAIGGGAVGGGTPTTPGSVASGPDPRKAIVDVHYAAIMALKTKLGKHELLKMDSHLTTISEYEKRLSMPMTPGGTPGGTPGTPAPAPAPSGACKMPAEPALAGASFDAVAKAQIEIAVLALECDITASVSLAFGNDQHSFTVPGYGESHQAHHCCATPDNYTKTVTYVQSLVVSAIQALETKGLLNSTVVTQVTDFGDAQAHVPSNAPLSVTGAGVKKGVVVSAGGKSQADLFQAVAEILGATTHANFRSFSKAPVTGLAL